MIPFFLVGIFSVCGFFFVYMFLLLKNHHDVFILVRIIAIMFFFLFLFSQFRNFGNFPLFF